MLLPKDSSYPNDASENIELPSVTAEPVDGATVSWDSKTLFVTEI
jgi:hypothetical protein